MTVKLATDARVLNTLANHPDILPYVAPKGTESIDFDVCFEPDRIDRIRFFHNEAESIGMFFDWSAPDIWELHMLAMPEARGGDALAFASEVITEMFFNRGAREIWGKTPRWNERARAMHRKVGGISRGLGIDPVFGEVEYFSTPRGEWKAPKA